MSARRTNVKIAKFVLLGLIVTSLVTSAYLIWHSIDNYKTLSVEEGEDFFTGDKGRGYYAKRWMILEIFVLATTDLVTLVCSWGVFHNMSTISLLFGIYMSCVSTYMAYDGYMAKTFVAFILPQVIAIVAILFAVINYLFKNDNPIQMDAVMELSKRTVNYEPVKAAPAPAKAVEEYHDDE